MKKKLSALMMLILVIVLCFSLTACNDSSELNKELIVNGTFEAEKTTNGWKQDITDKSKVSYTSQKEDSNYIIITNNTSVTSNLFQNIKVEKASTYKITARYRINSQIKGSTGFSIGFIEDKGFSPKEHYLSSNGWETYTIYITPEINNLSLSLKLSGQGTVMVDDVSMMKVDKSTIPAEANVYKINTVSELPYNKTPGGITFAVLMTVLTAVIMLAGYFVLRRNASQDNFLPVANNDKVSITKRISLSPIAIVGILMTIGFVVRFILATTVYGYDKMYDDAATSIANIGITAYYYTSPSIITPGYIYYLGLYGLLKKAATITSVMGVSIMLKLPSILADIGVIYLLFSFGRKYVGDKNASVISLLYAILPPVFMLNAGWGGIESLAVLGFVAMFICMIEKKNIGLFFSSLYSLMFCFETVFVLPIVISYLVVQCVKDKKFIAKAIIGSIILLILFYLLTLPMSLAYARIGKPFIIVTRYYDVLAAEAMACINNFSIYAIIGLNNQLASKASFVLSIVFVVFLWVFAIYCYAYKRNRLNLLLVGAFTMLAINTFAVNQTKIPVTVGALMLLMYSMLSRDKRVYILSGGFMVLNAMNIFTLFDMAGYFTDHLYRYQMFVKFDWLQVLGSVLMVILVIALMFVVYDICVGERRKEIQPIYDKEVEEFKQNIFTKLKIKKAISK